MLKTLEFMNHWVPRGKGKKRRKGSPDSVAHSPAKSARGAFKVVLHFLFTSYYVSTAMVLFLCLLASAFALVYAHAS